MIGQSLSNPVVSNALTNIFNSIPYPIFCKDQQHRFVSLNDILCEYLGYSREQMIGKSDLDFFPKSECEVFWALDDEVLRTGQVSTIEEVITDAYGIIRRLRTKKGKLRLPNGEELLVGISFVLDDDALHIEESEEDEIFNAETLHSIEQLAQVCLSSQLKNPTIESYVNSLTVSKLSELFLHDKEFLQQFIDRIPYYACYTDHAGNLVSCNSRLKKFMNSTNELEIFSSNANRDFKELCGSILFDKDYTHGSNICKSIMIKHKEYLLCAQSIPIVGSMFRLHGRLNVFDLQELDTEKGIDLDYYKNSSMFAKFEKTVTKLKNCVFSSASSVLEFADQNCSEVRIKSIDQLQNISRASSQLSQKLDKLLKLRGISLKEWQVLNVVVEFVYPTPSIVSQQLGVANSATSKLLDALETKGMVERRYRQQDRRKIRLWYTEKGHLAWLYGKQLGDRLIQSKGD